MVCSGTLTSTTSGPLGESCGFHQYSPGLSGPVGLPVGVPLVWEEGCGIACELVSRATEMARTLSNFMVVKRVHESRDPTTMQPDFRPTGVHVKNRRGSVSVDIATLAACNPHFRKSECFSIASGFLTDVDAQFRCVKRNQTEGECMIEHNLDTAHSILYVRPKSALEQGDFVQLAKTVDPFIEETGNLAGLIIEAPAFPGWESLGAMAAHFRFVRDHTSTSRRSAS